MHEFLSQDVHPVKNLIFYVSRNQCLQFNQAPKSYRSIINPISQFMMFDGISLNRNKSSSLTFNMERFPNVGTQAFAESARFILMKISNKYTPWISHNIKAAFNNFIETLKLLFLSLLDNPENFHSL
ncbi:CLUMA_CG004451, isoform A [Clunio marinus]|uniref:CLUMA_CG004451, isoform A n=1 Tax=Clunio marinus TaxID=568069 RepID=A0A1J1HRS4_9DIPT|nr:CLUMA_CG004451, isoform A [Clunio marinus]